ncbi:MAG: pyridoxal 5'-phosphate synthase glutaminase subunit PdxT [Euryarchaeota archaeon]|nr:pyridoxal 5'-phosphate synthase glutaminase subunit PdxT [Euryarchaeota archaeon]MDE1837830.1 pyridoxal 5'-phosphate synthase glutaminase subunit PdxT [Euryarchaeota archaeon]MDE1880104.1 pyridoxal 5'-phosphate synthase glutaminase subunit PdxT [Euryarchaeota archaeon]MDE2045058.1 pyridoxal 5'-phosphate synthase glutaminase subunit PdxT [Thermoplasmata archaeon]
MSKRAGVLALQGDVPQHLEAAAAVLGGDRVLEVRTPKDLEQVEALFLPGGESTTLSQLLDKSFLRVPLTSRIRQGLPVLATCAGLILLARELEPTPHGRDPEPLRVLDVKVRRNDYGRQADSFETVLEVEGVGKDIPAAFIRAPRILSVGSGVQVLSRVREDPVIVRQGSIWGLTFHPEVTGDHRLHAAFLRASGLLS